MERTMRVASAFVVVIMTVPAIAWGGEKRSEGETRPWNTDTTVATWETTPKPPSGTRPPTTTGSSKGTTTTSSTVTKEPTVTTVSVPPSSSLPPDTSTTGATTSTSTTTATSLPPSTTLPTPSTTLPVSTSPNPATAVCVAPRTIQIRATFEVGQAAGVTVRNAESGGRALQIDEWTVDDRTAAYVKELVIPDGVEHVSVLTVHYEPTPIQTEVVFSVAECDEPEGTTTTSVENVTTIPDELPFTGPGSISLLPAGLMTLGLGALMALSAWDRERST